MGLHGPNLKMGEPLSDDNEYGRNLVGSNPPGEPHISGGIRGPSGAKLGNWGGCGGKPPQKIKSVRLRSPMLSLRALGMKMMFFQVVFRVSGPRGPEKGKFWGWCMCLPKRCLGRNMVRLRRFELIMRPLVGSGDARLSAHGSGTLRAHLGPIWNQFGGGVGG